MCQSPKWQQFLWSTSSIDNIDVLNGMSWTERPERNVLNGTSWTERPERNVLNGTSWTERPERNVLNETFWMERLERNVETLGEPGSILVMSKYCWCTGHTLVNKNTRHQWPLSNGTLNHLRFCWWFVSHR
jgi:hypothetical protein